MTRALCSIPKCDRPAITKTWCQGHYTKWRRHGDPIGGRSAHLMWDRRTHGMTGSPEYVSWMDMRRRCEGHDGHDAYVARGITVCARWQNSFENFLADMGARPSRAHTIDRIDNNGNYEPGNCRWATMVTQANNRSNNRVVVYRGEKLSLRQALRNAGDVVAKDTARRRLLRGWPVEVAVETPPNSRFDNRAVPA